MRRLWQHDGVLVRFNKELAQAFGFDPGQARRIFCVSSGAVWAGTSAKPPGKRVKYSPLTPKDFSEGRVFRVFAKGLPVMEAKGCGRITGHGMEPIDPYGPYETGPPGGLWLGFALKEYDRGIRVWKSGVRVCNIPLCVVTLPFFVNVKKGSRVGRKRLAVEGRLLLQPLRIEDVCWMIKTRPLAAAKLVKHFGFGSVSEYTLFFCGSFGSNLRSLFDAGLTHFALWNGGDVGMFGEIADFDSIHGLNARDLADCVDGAFSTVRRLILAAGVRGERHWNAFVTSLLGEPASANSKEELYSLVTGQLLACYVGMRRPARWLLIPKFNLPEHKVGYFSNLAVK
ncbi:hypothetical protein HYS54_04990 [Candidatus Micrarchaeota archaeon]|nr:hypothetical protein [Candidatus Micrarchaeota archaeon]